MSWLTKVSSLFRGKKSYGNFAVLPSLYGLRSGGLNAVGSPVSAMRSPTYASSILWIQNNITEPEIEVQVKGAKEWEPAETAPELVILEKPTIVDGQLEQTWTDRLQGIASDLKTYGNAYCHKELNAGGAIVGIRWIPAQLVMPQLDNMSLRVKEYRVGSFMGKAYLTIQPGEMIHFKMGRDPNNLALGYACISAIGDALLQDCEGASYMRRNLKGGSLGLLGTPETDADESTDWAALSTALRDLMQGENSSVGVVNAKLKLQNLGFTPEQMALNVMLTHAQQTICGAVGVPAQVLGIMASEKTSTFANVREAGRHAAANCLGPLWDIIAETLSYHIFPDGKKRFRFDWGNISALQEDENDRWKRSTDAYKGGVITRGQAKTHIGIEPAQGDDEWYSMFDRLPAVPGIAIERPN